jgi:hypothetical protein
VQVQDCIDCLKILLHDQYKSVFLFENSIGHAKKRINGPDAKNMTKGWGGKEMRPTMIECSDGFVGPFHGHMNPRMRR